MMKHNLKKQGLLWILLFFENIFIVQKKLIEKPLHFV